MKISRMTTDQAADALCRIAPPFTRMLQDKETVPALQQLMDSAQDEKPVESLTAVLLKVVPYLLKDHKNDVYEIIGALTGKTEQQIGKQNILKTVQDIKDSLDQDLIDFFRSSGGQTKTSESE